MRRFTLVFSICLLCAVNAQAVLVIGYAYLSGQSEHENIRVIFEAVSPSAETDTTYTSTYGAFSATLEPGVYNVLYSHVGYAEYRLPNQILLWNTALDPVTLLPPLSGYLSGSLGPGDFQVTDSIVVATGNSLTIQPGTRLFFDGMHRFVVRGLLTAVGTEEDSIVFTRRYASGPDTAWNGIIMSGANDSCRLDHVTIEHAYRDGSYPYDGDGAALYCQGTDVNINSSFFRNNRSSWGGSIAYFEACNPHVFECTFEGNWAYGWQGVATWNNASPTFVSNSFQNNIGTALYGQGNGIAVISQCGFRDNDNFGSYVNGINASYASSVSIDRCLFSQSSAISGSLVALASTSSMSRCTFFGRGDYDDGMISVHGNAMVSSCALFVTSGTGLYFGGATESQVQFCDIFAPNGQNFMFYQNDPSNGPPAIGLIALTNPNGDSCDTYYNIFLDPQLVDTAAGDYHLQAGSPCIDAGDPELSLDPDGTVADIGAFYFDQLKAEKPFILPPSSFILSAYPNPFNSTTQIVFELPKAVRAELVVYDVTGRRVTTLFSGMATAGRNTVSLAAEDLPSGIYFCRLAAGDARATRKLILMK